MTKEIPIRIHCGKTKKKSWNIFLKICTFLVIHCLTLHVSIPLFDSFRGISQLHLFELPSYSVPFTLARLFFEYPRTNRSNTVPYQIHKSEPVKLTLGDLLAFALALALFLLQAKSFSAQNIQLYFLLASSPPSASNLHTIL